MKAIEAGSTVFEIADDEWSKLSEENKILFPRKTEFRALFIKALNYGIVCDKAVAQVIYLKQKELQELKELRR